MKDYIQYIEDRICWDGYQDEDPENKFRFLLDTFESEYGWAIDRHGYQGALREWLMGLPSSINIPFMNHEIIELAKEMDSLQENATEHEEEKILDNYWNFMAAQIMKGRKRESSASAT